MIDVDRRAIELAGGSSAHVHIIPAAAAPDNNHHRAGQNGVQWFTRLGVRHVASLPLIDHHSAQLPEIYDTLSRSNFVYLLGGFPLHLANSLRDTKSWQSILSVYAGGGIIGGSSAGAMVLCEYYYDPFGDKVLAGLGILPGTCIIPHHNRYGDKWLNRLRLNLTDLLLIGLDEQTAIINDAAKGGWNVYGRGAAVLHETSGSRSYCAGNVIHYNKLQAPII